VTVSLANGQTTVAANQSVVLQFNRFLNPSTITRQTVQLVNASGNPLGTPAVDYDPVLLQVTLSKESPTAGWLMEGQLYGVNVVATTSAAADGNAGVSGIEAIDRATLAAPTKIAFKASAPVGAAPTEPTMHFCVDVWPIFQNRRCATDNGCHGPPSAGDPDSGIFPTPRQALVLADSDSVKATAVGRVSHESNIGALAAPSAPSANFGINMPIIDPGTNGVGDPGNSWMLYKVLLGAPSPASTPALNYSCSYDSFTTALSWGKGETPMVLPGERDILSNYVIGREMPYPFDPSTPESQGGGSAADALTLQEMERLRLWIKQGAQFDDVATAADGGTTCNAGCSMITPPAHDAGAKDGGPRDAAHDGPNDGGTSG